MQGHFVSVYDKYFLRLINIFGKRTIAVIAHVGDAQEYVAMRGGPRNVLF
jgi:hypothetical protein